MNFALDVLGWIGWMTVFVFLAGGAWILWVAFASINRPEQPAEQTATNLPKCPACGWVQGVNSDCQQCQYDRKVLP